VSIFNTRDFRTSILVLRDDPRAGDAFKAHLEGDVGYDIAMWHPTDEVVLIQPNSFASLPTGLRVKVGDNAWGMIRPRSSTFYKKNLFVAEGTIDPGYTGPLFITVFNPKPVLHVVRNGERLAQLVPVPKFSYVEIRYVTELPQTARGEKGFGSTG